MSNTTEGRLQIYKASAGSGKTHTLVEKYLGMLLEPSPGDPSHPKLSEGYRKILVATFTNKATAELRERIVRELHNISLNGQRGERERAKLVLEEILLDYGSLRVQTIDSFFQEVVRGFVLELNNSSAGAEVALDSDSAIEISVDNLLIQQGGDSLLWLANVLRARAEEESSTDIRTLVITLAKQMLYHPLAEQYDLTKLSQSDIKAATKELATKSKSLYATMQSAYDDMHRLLKSDEEYLKESAYGFLNSLYNKSLKELLEKKWKEPNSKCFNNKVNLDKPAFILSSTNAKEYPNHHLLQKEEVYRGALNRLEETLSNNCREYQLAMLLKENLRLLPILSQLKQTLEEYQKEHKVVLIEEIDKLVKQVINGASLPIIYEKTGGAIGHYMLDEFQDTNRTQWNNFKPLLKEALDSGYRSYIVGDVKQSIYRWRGTDSSLLNSGVEEELSAYATTEPLGANWRSAKRIVDFNNALFNNIYNFPNHCNIEGVTNNDTYHKIYESGVVQEPKQTEERGYIRFERLEDEEEEFPPRLKELLIKLHNDGYSPGDIAIVVRTNYDATKVADTLTQLATEEPEHSDCFAFLSDEALLIRNSSVVSLITALYQHIANPFSKQYATYFHVACLASGIREKEKEQQLIQATQQGATLFETTRTLLSIIGVPENEELHISAFLDLLHEFMESEPNTYLQFSNWWKRIGMQKKVSMGSDLSDKIEIITLHKAKGLEFPVVIIPYLNWEISKTQNNKNLVFCSNNDLPSGFLTHPLPYYIIPEAPTDQRLNSLLRKKYIDIHESNYLDNLNLLYVAFTRAEERLYLFTKEASNTKKVTKIIYDRLEVISPLLGTTYHKDQQIWSYGVEEKKQAKEKKKQSTEGIAVELQMKCQETQSILKRIDDEEVYENATIRYGLDMHDVMANTLVASDFPKALEALKLPKEEYDARLAYFNECTADPLISDWFTEKEGRSLLTEATIFTGEEQRHRRPDRLILEGKEATVIDYKFGEASESTAHQRQVRGYMELLEAMGYSTKGYLWYWKKGKLKEVERKDL